MRQCDAITPASTYTESHRCLKRHGLKKLYGRTLCPHHYAKRLRTSSQGAVAASVPVGGAF